MSHAKLVLLLAVPVLLWAGVSYTGVGSVVGEARESPRLAFLVVFLWAVGSIAYLLLLRRLARALRRRFGARPRTA